MSPNGSGSRYWFSCLRTTTDPRSVALTTGRTTGSTKRARSGSAGGAGVWAIVGLREVSEAVRLVRHDERIDERVELALQHARHVVDRGPDPVVGHPVVREVVRPDLLGALSPADHQPAVRALRFALFAELHVVQPGSQHRHRLGLVLVLALLVLDLDDEPRREVRDAHGRVRRVDGLAARARAALDLDPEVALLVDVHLDVVDLGQHDDGRRAGV